MQNENWQDEAHRRLGDYSVAVSSDGWGWAYQVGDYPEPAWALKLVEVRLEELEGLDRAGFRDLVRGKLQQVGDDLLKAWEARNVGDCCPGRGE